MRGGVRDLGNSSLVVELGGIARTTGTGGRTFHSMGAFVAHGDKVDTAFESTSALRA